MKKSYNLSDGYILDGLFLDSYSTASSEEGGTSWELVYINGMVYHINMKTMNIDKTTSLLN